MTITLGSEHDAKLQDALMNALREIGASVGAPDWAVGGSQEIMSIIVEVDGIQIQIESETYVGLTLKGDPKIIELLADRTREIRDKL